MSFSIYNASAGSGKTFTLAKDYLKILLTSTEPEPFKRILAITFTNKAVGEMKERILGYLKTFSDEAILTSGDTMFSLLSEELNQLPEVLHRKSKTVLQAILHNYGAFDISTIDKFTHKILRTFAHDLKLALNFEVELDTEALLAESVDNLIAKTGTDKALTKTLVDFAIEKADDDKSWDVGYDFNKIAKLLINDNDRQQVETLKDKSLEDFKALKTTLRKSIKETETALVEKAQKTLDFIDECGLEHSDFSRGSIPKYFLKLSKGDFSEKYEAKWQETIETATLYPKRVSDDVASTIDNIQPDLATAFHLTRDGAYQLLFYKAVYKKLTPLSVLNLISREVETLKAEQDKLLISEFNSIISKHIKNQPTPFIYERLGEKFRHYFIDEFQDTSVMQWENLQPLIENALVQEKNGKTGSLILVGDAKQAIYRWRGGRAEQFMDLYNGKQPFPVEQQVENLKFNFRSYREIVNFNNNLFKHLSETVFDKDNYADLYAKSHQEITKEGGFVTLDFLDIQKDDDKDEVYCEQVYNTVQNCLKNGYKLSDICILVRKKKEGLAISKYFAEPESERETIDIISNETMLLDNAPEVRFINKLLHLLENPDDKENTLAVLYFLAEQHGIKNKHGFFEEHLDLTPSKLFKSFEKLGIQTAVNNAQEASLYDLAEAVVRDFNLVKTSNAYVQFYLDAVLEFTEKHGSDIKRFLEWFDGKKDKLSIVSPEGVDAVQIMTIHKSKGLEFPVVIFPYADLDIYKEIEPKTWFELDADKFNGFETALINFNKNVEHFGDQGKAIYQEHRAQLELDNINLLYVALTRPVERLHIISKLDLDSKKQPKSNTYAGMLIGYLMSQNEWNDDQMHYDFGNPQRGKVTETETATVETSTFVSTPLNTSISTDKTRQNISIVTRSGLLWDTVQAKAIEKGNLIHDLMAKVKNENDINFALNDFVETAVINKEQTGLLEETVRDVVHHPKLQPYFNTDNYTIYTERDILSSTHGIVRPDRLAIDRDKVVIIDYKTGKKEPLPTGQAGKHRAQLNQYQEALEEMGFVVTEKLLVYVNEGVEVDVVKNPL